MLKPPQPESRPAQPQPLLHREVAPSATCGRPPTLATTLVGGASLIEDPTLKASNLTLIIGPGFTGIRPLASGADGASGSSGTAGSSDGGSSGDGSTANGGSGSGTKKPAEKAVPDLRPYDPRPC